MHNKITYYECDHKTSFSLIQCVCVCVSYVEYASTQGHWKYICAFIVVLLLNMMVVLYGIFFRSIFFIFFSSFYSVHDVSLFISIVRYIFSLHGVSQLEMPLFFFSYSEWIWDVTRIRLYAKVQFRDLHFGVWLWFDSIWYWAETFWERALARDTILILLCENVKSMSFEF